MHLVALHVNRNIIFKLCVFTYIIIIYIIFSFTKISFVFSIYLLLLYNRLAQCLYDRVIPYQSYVWIFNLLIYYLILFIYYSLIS